MGQCHTVPLNPMKPESSNPVPANKSLRLHRQITSSADEIAGNDDLLTGILLHLPSKSLLKFKSVSKHWFSLISNPHFSHLRNPNSLSSGLLLFRFSRRYFNNNPFIPEFDFIPLQKENSNAPTEGPFKSLTFISDQLGVHIFQSCNGLLCCCSNRVNEPEGNYYIVNPTTKKFTKLPKPSSAASRTIFGMSLAFDPSKSPHYRAVCVRSYDTSWDRYEIEIYSSETGTWKVCGNPFSAYTNIMCFNGGVFWNGAVHWMSTRGTSLCFDVVEERLRKMPMPSFPLNAEEREFAYVGVSRGHLHLVEIYNRFTMQFNVYEMKSDYSKWFVKYCVNLDTVSTVFPEMIHSYQNQPDLHYYEFAILSVVEGETDEESFLVLHLPGKAVRYNVKDDSLRKLCDFDHANDGIAGTGSGRSLRFSWFHAFQYIESLSFV